MKAPLAVVGLVALLSFGAFACARSTSPSGGGAAAGVGCSEGQGQCQCFDPAPSMMYSAAKCTASYPCCFTQTVNDPATGKSTKECQCTSEASCKLPSGATKAASCP